MKNANHECHPEIVLKKEEECRTLTENDGFLNNMMRLKICKLQCSQFGEMCKLLSKVDEDAIVSNFSIKEEVNDFLLYLNSTIAKLFDEYDQEKGFTEEKFSDSVEVNTFFYFLKRTFPATIPIIPLVLNQFEYFNFWWYIIGMIVILPMYFIAGFFSNIQMLYNLFIWTLCLLTESGRNPLKTYMYSYALLVTSILFSLYHKGWEQYFVALVAVVLHLCFIYGTFMVRDFAKGNGVAIFMGYICILWEQLSMMHSLIRLETFSFMVIRAVQNAILPNGRYGYLYKNVFDIAYSMVKYVDYKYKIVVFVVAIVLQVLLFIFVRCLFGTYVINALRFKIDAKSFFTGGLLYSSGIFGGFHYLLGLLFREEPKNGRRVMYSLVNIFMLMFEFTYAFDYVIIRLLLWCSDTILWSSIYSKAPRYLNMNIDMRRVAYPQDCKSVWVSMDYMKDVVAHVKKLRVMIDGKYYSGLGFVRQHSDHNKASLLSINHVGNCQSVEIDGVDYLQPKITKLSGADDPIVSVELSPFSGDSCKNVNLLTTDEIPMVKQVIISSLADGSDEPMVFFSSEFHVDKSGDLRIRSCLREGDSGGPVFAALSDGNIRYAGAVSRTTDDRCVGHKFAFVTTAGGIRYNSDDEHSPVSNRVAIDFNRQRNPNNLSNLNYAQKLLFDRAKDFGHWVVDVATEDGYRWIPDGEDDGHFEQNPEIEKPEDYEKKKKANKKKKKRLRDEAISRLAELSRSSRYVYHDNDERKMFMRFINKQKEFVYKPGSVVNFQNGVMVVDDTPDPSEYSTPYHDG
jgi:hypothetical protein